MTPALPSTPTQRAADAIIAAQDAFWAKVAEHYPEVKMGDFPPDADRAFATACAVALKTWLTLNAPKA